VRPGRSSVLAIGCAVVAAALLVVFASSGRLPGFRGLVKFEAGGIVGLAPESVTRVELRRGDRSIVLHRGAGGWVPDGAGEAVPAELAKHLDAGLRFLNVSKPTREIAERDLDAGSFAGFGLDPPAGLVLLGTADGPAATVNFGSLNPPGTSQYARLGGAATVYLMPRHVGGEWDVVQDMASRLPAAAGPASAGAGAGTGHLLPVSMARVWAVEVIRAGALTRFERDSAGDWFRHTGTHSHAAGAVTHKADPAQARLIAAALGAFGETPIERQVAQGVDAPGLAEFGLAFPEIIVLLYARDNPTPVARLELGQLSGGFDRFARLAPGGDVVTIAEFEVRHLTGLLKAMGVPS